MLFYVLFFVITVLSIFIAAITKYLTPVNLPNVLKQVRLLTIREALATLRFESISYYDNIGKVQVRLIYNPCRNQSK